jgi:hypothetical protein
MRLHQYLDSFFDAGIFCEVNFSSSSVSGIVVVLVVAVLLRPRNFHRELFLLLWRALLLVVFWSPTDRAGVRAVDDPIRGGGWFCAR